MRTPTVRVVALIGAVALLLGAFVATPAVAKKKKKKAPAACAPYSPGEKGAGQPITVVTDAATKDAPVEVTVATDPGLGSSSATGEGEPTEGLTSHTYTNVQIDSAAPSAGLYVSLQFDPQWDYDLWMRDSGHAAVAYSAGSSPTPTPFTDGTGNGGHTETGSENIDGYAAADCNGFTIDIANAGSPGGDVVVKYWLGTPGG
jgi:hypothetical protein